MADPELVSKLDGIAPREFSGDVCRHIGPGVHPLSTTGAQTLGGRWNPPNSFPTLYLALSDETAAAEFYRRAQGEHRDPEDLLPRRLHRYRVLLSAVLDLRDDQVRADLGIAMEDLVSNDRSFCNALGDAAHYVGFEGLLAPSATGTGEVLVVFFDRLKAESDVEPTVHTDWTSPP
ncbi:MAG: RES family NAD+ phosphorylase [Actinomycetota bacterium]|nr:RES family NAD+ phosphorylase [Actinomycetota bacterium]